jgi:hypothetical protein
MRNRLQLAVTGLLLAAQATTSFPGMVAASATSTTTAGVPQLEVSINTNKPNPVVVTGPKQPNFDTDVLVPLRAKQAAQAAAAQAAAAQAAAQAAQVARVSRVVTTVAAVLTPGSHIDWMAAALVTLITSLTMSQVGVLQNLIIVVRVPMVSVRLCQPVKWLRMVSTT